MKQAGFNPKARWDRHVPETDTETSAPEELDEKIDVLTWFKGTKILPCAFNWNGRLLRIKKITYSWQERSGRETLNFFSVDTGANIYQMSFNNSTYAWRLDKIIS